ncbi:MAG TPA: carboxypeptidase regulatory-like domain-containing protein [Thermoplasmatales archaeon]|nr:carboxypeptidase regulatory-like domain-containing protein [Thermoplasmatales archaeon]
MKKHTLTIIVMIFATMMFTSTVAFAGNLNKTQHKNIQNGGFQGYVKSGGKGLSGATVTARRIIPASGFTVSATTDSNGYYRIDIPTGKEGTYRLTAKASGYLSQTKTAATMPPLYINVDFYLTKSFHPEKNTHQSHLKNVNIKPTSKPKPKQMFGFYGYVLDARTGEGIANAHLTARLSGSTTSYSTRTDSTGYYVMEVSLPGVYKVKVTAEGYLTKRLTIVVTGPLYMEINISMTKTKNSQQKDVKVEPINPTYQKTVYLKNTVSVFNSAFWKTKIVKSGKHGNTAMLRYICSFYHISS